ncbi:GTP pyrophosphokinase [bacterium]|nr:GTP pyrophosphokinase [bacterium]
MATLERAIRIAAQIHEGQADRYGSPYILHPLRVMMRCSGERAMIVATLHDVVEDSDMTLDDLRKEGFDEETVMAIDCLTKRDGEAYMQYIERVKPDPLAVKVKLADLEDNIDPTRIPVDQPLDGARLARYHEARRVLMRGDKH